MEKGISLCLTYMHGNISSKKSMYRVADYIDGIFYPVDPAGFSEDNESFSPRFLRFPPEYDPELFSAVIRKWEAIPKTNFPECNKTKSFPCPEISAYELIFGLEKYKRDASLVQEALKNGISIPKGVSEDILLVIDETSDTYTVLYCRKGMFKEKSGKYFLNNKLSDMIHTYHFLKLYTLEKDDVFDTLPFTYLHVEDEENSRVRYFYMYDYLPEDSKLFYLYELPDYIPFFIARFIKMNDKSEFTKAQIQKIQGEIIKALTCEKEIKSFFESTGYEYDYVKEQLEVYKDLLLKYFSESDEINDVIMSQLQLDENIREKYLPVAKEIWLKEADKDRDIKAKDIERLDIEIQNKQVKIGKLGVRIEALLEKEKKLKAQAEEAEKRNQKILESINDGIIHLDQEISEHIKNYLFLRNLSGTQVQNEGQCHTLRCYKSELKEDEGIKEIDDITKAIKILEHNISQAGVQSYFSGVLARLLMTDDTFPHSVIVSGYYARSMADAISFSIEGIESSRITLIVNNVNYEELYDSVLDTKSRVVLVENLLDSYNEVAFAGLNKDFKNKIFIFSIENDENFGILSKSIWNYSYLVNTDISHTKMVTNAKYVRARITSDIKRYPVDDEIDILNIENMLTVMGLPVLAKKNIYKIVGYLTHTFDNLNSEEFIMSVLAKLAFVYASSLDEVNLDEIKKKLPDEMKKHYFT